MKKLQRNKLIERYLPIFICQRFYAMPNPPLADPVAPARRFTATASDISGLPSWGYYQNERRAKK